MLQSIDLDTLHHILKQYSEDVLSDCSQITCKLLNSLNETTVLQDLKTIRVLLNLFGKLFENNCEIKVKFPIKLLFENIKKALKFGDGNHDLDNNIHMEVSHILHSFHKIPGVGNCSEAVEELAKLYDYCMTYMSTALTVKGCKQESLIFKLKIVQTVYNLLRDSFCNINMVQFCEMLKSNGRNECEIFTKLVLHGDDDVAMQVLLFLVPTHIDCFKSDEVLQGIWKEMATSVTDSSVNYARAMLILCSIMDTYFDSAVAKKEFFFTYLLEDANYWKLLQSVLIKDDPLLRKQGMYVFKKVVEALNATQKKIICSRGNIIIFYWDSLSEKELCKTYNELITILEFLDEQQIHIVKPIFTIAETVLNYILQCDKMSPNWVFVVCHKALIHEKTVVSKWGLSKLLFCVRYLEIKNHHQQGDIIEKTVALLVPKLNNSTLYYGDGLAVKCELSSFFQEMASLNTAFFSLFIKQVCSLVWSPESLYFVMDALSEIPDNMFDVVPSWTEDEIFHMRTFVSKAFKTYNKVMAVGIQHSFLRAMMTFVDVKNTPLKSVLLLISSFPLIESPTGICECFEEIVTWLSSSYSDLEAEEVLLLYKNQQLGKEFNERSMSVMFILLYGFFKDKSSNYVKNELSEMLSSFKGIERRPYCQKSLYDLHISVIGYIFKTSKSFPFHEILKFILPLVEDAIAYIRLQLKQISQLQDLSTHKLYLNAFENVAKAQKLFHAESHESNNMLEEVLTDLESRLRTETASLEFYFRIQFLYVLLEFHPPRADMNLLASYLLTEVNAPLEKEENHGEHTRDRQTLWGRINSEFIATKWKIMEHSIGAGWIAHGAHGITHEELMRLCTEGLNTGGYEVLRPVMSVLKGVLPAMGSVCAEAVEIIAFVWTLIMERRGTDEFKALGKGFVEMLFDEGFIRRGESAEKVLVEYADNIFSTPSLSLVNILMRHIQRIDLALSSEPLFCRIIAKALIFGPVPRRDERLAATVHSRIVSTLGCDAREAGEYFTSNEVRARAVERILMLRRDSERHRAVAKNLADILMKIEGKVGGGPDRRYFCDSHVHRVKHRAVQALLLLEPLLSGEEERKPLLDWLYKGLLTENPQRSVRCLKEWLLTRMLVRAPELEATLYHQLLNHETIKSMGLCSLMGVHYHFCRLVLNAETDAIGPLVPFLAHQHVDVRRKAQAFFFYHYNQAMRRGSNHVVDKWRGLHEAMHPPDGHSGHKPFQDLQQDFFHHSFHPLEHYSLQAIYSDLPELTTLSSDEWISPRLFLDCGLDPQQSPVPVEGRSLRDDALEFRALSFVDTPSVEETSQQIIDNHQKKIIPIKQSTGDWDERSDFTHFNEDKEGLVVVASLIDRMPNLGGLARTCEIFGVSEYVIGSLNYIKDKQFTNLSVTAEKWIALKELKAYKLSNYIVSMKQEGYTVVGAEQTLRSQPLNRVKFPKKTLLLLGNEKEGIPPNLLPLLDVCVEIPQMGIIRSLNVHVTGALIIWEYAKQNNFSHLGS